MQGLESMAYPLPEDIQKLIFAGELKNALRMIDIYLERGVTAAMRDRLQLEKLRIARIPDNYPYTRAEAIAMLREHMPDFSDADFDELEATGDIQYVFVEHERRYFSSFRSSLYFLRPDVAARAGRAESAENAILDEAIAKIKQRGSLSYCLHVRASLRVDDDCFQPDTYRVYLPLPAAAAQQTDMRVISTSPAAAAISPESSPARVAFFENRLEESQPFVVEYEYVNTVRYFNMDMPVPAQPLYPNALPVTDDDLAEQPGHIVFTPYLRALAAEICAGETDPLRKARRIYDYITTHVRYSYMRDYFLLPMITEYIAAGLRGDCGVQSLLFITLCRIEGIPARWQSGLTAEPDGSSGCHDWAQFYIDGFGWLFADCSYGGGALRRGSRERWDFYFGNLDPFRMVANARFQPELVPAKLHETNDPYDSQAGECETLERMVKTSERTTHREVIEAVELA